MSRRATPCGNTTCAAGGSSTDGGTCRADREVVRLIVQTTHRSGASSRSRRSTNCARLTPNTMQMDRSWTMSRRRSPRSTLLTKDKLEGDNAHVVVGELAILDRAGQPARPVADGIVGAFRLLLPFIPELAFLGSGGLGFFELWLGLFRLFALGHDVLPDGSGRGSLTRRWAFVNRLLLC